MGSILLLLRGTSDQSLISLMRSEWGKVRDGEREGQEGKDEEVQCTDLSTVLVSTGVGTCRLVQTCVLKGGIDRFALFLPPDPGTLAETYNILQM